MANNRSTLLCKQVHERILESLVLPADVAANVAVRRAVGSFQGVPEGVRLLRLGQRVAAGDDGGVAVQCGRAAAGAAFHRLRGIGGDEGASLAVGTPENGAR